MTAVAVETELSLEDRFRAVPGKPVTAWPGRKPGLIDELALPTRDDIQPWELHSELVLVCPEVGQRARELLPERDPNAFLTRPPEPVLQTTDEARRPNLAAAVVGYAFWRLLETARIAFFAVGGVVALALLAEVLH